MAAEIRADGPVAAERRAAGVDVILLLADGVPFVPGPGGPGRVAVFVTGRHPASGPDQVSEMDRASEVDRLSEVDRAAVTAMAAELFGGRVGAPGASPDAAQRADPGG